MVEPQFSKLDVAGSSPVLRSTKKDHENQRIRQTVRSGDHRRCCPQRRRRDQEGSAWVRMLHHLSPCSFHRAICVALYEDFSLKEYIAPRACSSVGRAPALQAGCRQFDPVQVHQASLAQQQSTRLVSERSSVRS